ATANEPSSRRAILTGLLKSAVLWSPSTSPAMAPPTSVSTLTPSRKSTLSGTWFTGVVPPEAELPRPLVPPLVSPALPPVALLVPPDTEEVPALEPPADEPPLELPLPPEPELPQPAKAPHPSENAMTIPEASGRSKGR